MSGLDDLTRDEFDDVGDRMFHERRDLARETVTPYWKTVQTEKPAGAPKKKPRHKAGQKRWAEIKAKKCAACLCCQVRAEDGHYIHAHHLVRKGAPYFGADTESNVVGLCSDCHRELHDQNTERIRKVMRVRLTVAEVAYADEKAYEGYLDDRLWRIRPIVTDGRQA